MEVIPLAWWQLALAALMVVGLAGCTAALRLGMSRSLLIAALRTVIQLGLIGLVLEALFAAERLLWVVLMALAMLLRSEEHTSELQSRPHLVCRLLLEKKKNKRLHIAVL